MTEEQRREKISGIMDFVRGTDFDLNINIPISAWIKAETDPFNGGWISICNDMVKWSEATTKKKDNDSIFAQCLRAYKANLKNKRHE